LLANGVKEHNSEALDRPLSVNPQSTEQEAYFLVAEDAVIMTPSQQSVHYLCQLSNKKVIRVRPVTEK
jgi:hypothetical protein